MPPSQPWGISWDQLCPGTTGQPKGAQGFQSRPSLPHVSSLWVARALALPTLCMQRELAHTLPPIVLHAILEPMAMHAMSGPFSTPKMGPFSPEHSPSPPLFSTGPCSPHVVGFVVMVPRPLSCPFHPMSNGGIRGPMMAAQVQTQVMVSPHCPPITVTFCHQGLSPVPNATQSVSRYALNPYFRSSGPPPL